jgi:hypothetical protein
MNINYFKENISTALDFLETELEKNVPEEGAFPKVRATIPVEYNRVPLIVELSIGAWKKPDEHSKVNNWEKMRYLEMTVTPQGEQVNSSTWIYNGTKSDLKKIIQSKDEIVSYIEKIFKKSIEHLQRDFEVKL